MKYLIVQDWPNTHGNHAGMVHMCEMLCKKYTDTFRMLVKPCPRELPKHKGIIGKFLGRCDRQRYRKQFVSEYFDLCQPMFANLKKGDEVFLLEYHLPYTTQFELARYIHSSYLEVIVYALSHLTPMWYRHHRGSEKMILEWEKVIDKQLTLGGSLTQYFVSIGIPETKLSTGFHYVDNEYYAPEGVALHDRPTVIVMGALQRDFMLISDIINGCPDVRWIVCKGHANIDRLFEGLDNVELMGFMDEDELRYQMSRADISLNVLEDTVGSNVITTSMAMGLAIVVSDVGSIHDYCSVENAVFCENKVQPFVDAINGLASNPELLLSKREGAYRKSKDFGIENIYKWFNNLYVTK